MEFDVKLCCFFSSQQETIYMFMHTYNCIHVYVFTHDDYEFNSIGFIRYTVMYWLGTVWYQVSKFHTLRGEAESGMNFTNQVSFHIISYHYILPTALV